MKSDSATTLEAGDTQKDTILENVMVSQHKEDRDQKTDKESANNQKTIEEVVNDIAGKPTVWSVVLVVLAMSYGLSVDSLTYDTVFAGLPAEKYRKPIIFCDFLLYSNLTSYYSTKCKYVMPKR